MSVPTVTGISPASGPAGTQVVITGTGFTEDTSRVYFYDGGEHGATFDCGTQFAVVDATQIVCYAPQDDGSGRTMNVRVTTPGGTSATGTASEFTYDPYVGLPGGGGGSAPTITSVVPDTATDEDGGDTVAVYGTDLTTTQKVYFGTTEDAPEGVFTVVSDTELSVVSPPGSGTVDITVVTEYGTSSAVSADEYTYPAAPVPTVTGISPATGGEGQRVVVTGTNFLASSGAVNVSTVTFAGSPDPVPCIFRVDSTTSLVCYVPEDATTGVITVYSTSGSATSASFTVKGTVYAVIQSSADGKNTIHYSTSDASGDGIAGDVWFKYGSGATAGQVVAQWTHSGSAWVATTLNNSVIATLDCAKLTAGTIDVAVELTSATITGGIMRTAEDGRRVEIDGTGSYADRISWYSGTETAAYDCPYITSYETASEERLEIIGPYLGNEMNGAAGVVIGATAAQHYSSLRADAGYADNGSVTVTTDYTCRVRADLNVDGKINPHTNWGSGTSADGVWVQEAKSGYTARRWKVYYNSDLGSDGKLVVRSAAGYALFIPDSFT